MFNLLKQFDTIMRVSNEFYKTEMIPLSFVYDGVGYRGSARPIHPSNSEGTFQELDVTLNHEHLGTIYSGNSSEWSLHGTTDQAFVDRIGEQITFWYQVF
jgi:hypothetical protein